MVSKFVLGSIMGLMSWVFFHFIIVSPADQLILFVDGEKPLIQQQHFDEIKGLADEMNLEYIIKEDQDGLPSEITTLPSIYFQNDLGRSKYYGRYSNISRIRNFIRTSKLSHKKNETSIKKDILVWNSGKADIIAPIKITSLEGEQVNGFDSLSFVNNAHLAIASGMQNFQLKDSQELNQHTKSFYFNIYPYLDESKKLSVSYEIFSQYNCIKPISRKLEPIIPPFKWKKRAKGFKEIGKIIEEDILQHIQQSTNGDAFQIVQKTTKIESWESLGLEIVSAKNEEQAILDPNISVARKWEVEQKPIIEEPIMVFSFLSPVDNYAGEVKALNGEMTLGEDLSMKNASGQFKVNIGDVTMGAKDFDNEVQNKMLKQSLFPDAHFEFIEIQGNSEPLMFGKPQKLIVLGNFTMLGISIPVNVETIIEAIQEEGLMKLAVKCDFQLPLFEKFKLKGPDGPSPAKDILQFYMKFNLIESI